MGEAAIGPEDWTDGIPVDATALRHTVGAFPSGVTVITTTHAGAPVGLTVSSFTSVSMNPPLLLVCVARTAGSLPAFRMHGSLAVNVLARGQAWIATRFASRHEERFDGVDFAHSANGSPLIAGTAAWISGAIERIYDAGDHVILLIRAQELHRSDARPLLYHSGNLHDWPDSPLSPPHVKDSSS